MVLFWSFRFVFVVSVFRFGRFACFGGFVSRISVVLFRLFRWFRFVRFGASFVSLVSFRCFGFLYMPMKPPLKFYFGFTISLIFKIIFSRFPVKLSLVLFQLSIYTLRFCKMQKVILSYLKLFCWYRVFPQKAKITRSLQTGFRQISACYCATKI